jgi:hypothetical protein
LSPVSATSANGVSWLTRYAAAVAGRIPGTIAGCDRGQSIERGVAPDARASRSSILRIAILLTLVACNDQDVQRLTAIKSKVCACKTASCAEQEMKLVPEQAIKSTHRTQGIGRELIGCVARLQEADRPSTDPDEEGTVEPPGAEPPAGAPPPGAPPTIAPPPGAPKQH